MEQLSILQASIFVKLRENGYRYVSVMKDEDGIGIYTKIKVFEEDHIVMNIDSTFFDIFDSELQEGAWELGETIVEL